MVVLSLSDEIEDNSFNRFLLSTQPVPGTGSLSIKGGMAKKGDFFN